MNFYTLRLSLLVACSLSAAALDPLAAQRKAVGINRNSHGRIARSSNSKREFERQTGYPRGRPGYVIDHIKPLATGGADTPGNMQWQTKADAKAKDKRERGGSSRAVTYRSRSYSRKSYAPRHRSTTARARTYRTQSTRSSSYRRYSRRRK